MSFAIKRQNYASKHKPCMQESTFSTHNKNSGFLKSEHRNSEKSVSECLGAPISAV